MESTSNSCPDLNLPNCNVEQKRIDNQGDNSTIDEALEVPMDEDLIMGSTSNMQPVAEHNVHNINAFESAIDDVNTANELITESTSSTKHDANNMDDDNFCPDLNLPNCNVQQKRIDNQ